MIARRAILVCAALVCAALAGFGAATVAPAREAELDLELVLAIDVSRSMDDEELELQRQGYAGAFLHPAIVAAIRGGAQGRIAVTMVEWAGSHHQRVIVPWTVIRDEESSAAFADAILAAPKLSFNWTSISGAIDFSRSLFGAGGQRGARRVIDISGDGKDGCGESGNPNDGAIKWVRHVATGLDITINGLPIVNDEKDVAEWYAAHVIGGPGAFLEVAHSNDDFAAAMRRKLVQEIAAR